MDARWKRIEELFARALELPPAERAQWLEKECAGERELREEVESLLAASDAGESYLSDLAGRAGMERLEQDASGKTVGNYRLLRVLGRGGMGVVYLAERADRQFEKRVAIKLLPLAMAVGELRRRFLSERQILARLEHPAIARLLDGGISDDGIPYFVMEYIDGLPIDVYCEQQQLSLEERLRLFLRVCDAVRYAHQNLVIHRDLKPANILVTRDGEPRLLDFGIAKLNDPEIAEPGAVTRLEARPMTPAYASPELIGGQGVGTPCDVYSLGVLLYKLLTGSLPFALDGHTEAEARETILTRTPRLPSKQVSGEADRHLLRVTRQGRRLQGDLDMIVMMALRKEPQRRYASAEQLAEDIRRHLANDPVRAQHDTPLYRMSRFYRRHRSGVIFGSALLLTILVSTALITDFAIRTVEQKNQIARERDKAEQIASFLESIFNGADPWVAGDRTITARELLARGARRVNEELADQPALQATMLNKIGMIYYGLRDRRAVPLLEKSLQIRRKLFGSMHPDTLESIEAMANLRSAQGQYAEAGRLFGEALEITTRLNGPDTSHAALMMLEVGSMQSIAGNYAAAEKLLTRAFRIQREASGKDAPIMAAHYNQLGMLHQKTGRLEQAESEYRMALRIDRETHGDHHPALLDTLNNLAMVLELRGRLEEAEDRYRRLIAEQRQFFKGDHQSTAMTLHNLARLLGKTGRIDRALEKQRTAIAMGRRLGGDSHPQLGPAINQLGHLLTLDRQYRKAEKTLRQALTLMHKTLPPGHYRIAAGHANLARLYHRQTRNGQAESEYRTALRMYEKALPAGHWRTATVRMELGKLLLETGKVQAARPLLSRSHASLRQALGPAHPRTQQAGALLAELPQSLTDKDPAGDGGPASTTGQSRRSAGS